MKKKDWILAGGICGLALVIWLACRFLLPGNNDLVRITVDGVLYGEYSLDEEQTVRIGESNVCRIENGRVRMTEADCPDKLCMHQKAIDSQGGTIVCLPNRVVIEGKKGGQETGVDAVA